MQAATDGAPRRLVDYDGYQVQYLPECDDKGLVAFHFAVKRSYTVVIGQTAQPAAVQRTLNLSDVFYDDENPLGSALRYPTDLLPPKPACDVVVNGHCYAPGGQALQCICSLQVGQNPRKSVRVIGDRSVWLPAGATRAEMAPARPFSVKALRWELAYGGIDPHHPAGPVPYPHNPVGTGFWAKPTEYDEPVDRWGALPNLEHTNQALSLSNLLVDVFDLDNAPLPAGFGWVPRTWTPRAKLAGVPERMSAIWSRMTGKKPGEEGAPPKLNPAFFQGAPAGQVIPHPNGGETIELIHMHPTEKTLRFRLPVDAPKLRWNCGFGFDPVRLAIDTIQIEPDLMALDLNWRGTLPTPEGVKLEKLKTAIVEIDGQIVLPAPLLDTGFPIELLTEVET